MKRQEEALQIICVEWFRLQYTGKMIYHIANSVAFVKGANKGAFFGMLRRLKNLGLKKGMPDLCIPYAAGKYHGMYIEMKIPGEDARPEQIDIHDELKRNGYMVEICQTFDEFAESVNEYFRQDYVEDRDTCPQE